MWFLLIFYYHISFHIKLFRISWQKSMKSIEIALLFDSAVRSVSSESRLPHDWAKRRCCFGGSLPHKLVSASSKIDPLLVAFETIIAIVFEACSWQHLKHNQQCDSFLQYQASWQEWHAWGDILDKKKDKNMTSSNLSRKVPRYSHGYSYSCHGPMILEEIIRNNIIQYWMVNGKIWS